MQALAWPKDRLREPAVSASADLAANKSARVTPPRLKAPDTSISRREAPSQSRFCEPSMRSKTKVSSKTSNRQPKYTTLLWRSRGQMAVIRLGDECQDPLAGSAPITCVRRLHSIILRKRQNDRSIDLPSASQRQRHLSHGHCSIHEGPAPCGKPHYLPCSW